MKIFGMIFLSGCIIFIVIYFLNKNSTSYKKKQLEMVTVKDLVERDADQDGVPDWKEALLGTDSKNPETFGKPDKEYLAEKQEEINQKNGITVTENEYLNDTQKFSREFLATIVSLQESGNLNESSVTQIADQLEKNVELKKELPDVYVSSDLKILSNPTYEMRKKYQQDMLKVIKLYKTKNLGEELTIMSQAIASNDEFGLQNLKPISNLYKKYAEDMKNVQVPEDAAPLHLKLINDIYKVGTAVDNMSNLFDNSLAGMIGISQYRTYIEATNSDYANLGIYLKDSGIIK
ncbi:MAG: hypothetical protein WC795_02160 [Candidatus Paceibacterota bacterium]